MLVKMLQSEMGVNDGEIHPIMFVKDSIVDIGDDLYRAFSGLGIIEDVEEKQLNLSYEKKVIEPKKTVKKTTKKGGKK